MNEDLPAYKTKTRKLPGTHWRQVSKKAFGLYKEIKSKTKRRPYVRSAHFNKQKIFLELFWHHLHEKENIGDKTRRAKYFPCAIELIRDSRLEPISKRNPNRRSEILHRFIGITPDNERFFVQIKEDENTGQKWLMSVFPEQK
ncbi:MAG: hypothetical protein AB1352_02750 [Patescibacteria group bacterium]